MKIDATNQPKVDLAIIVPSRGFMHTRFVRSLLGLHQHLANNKVSSATTLEASGSAGCNRYFGIQKSRYLDPKHYLFLDDDMVFCPDIYDRLKKHEQPIVGCNYLSRNQTNKNRPLYTSDVVDFDEDDVLVESKRIGFGIVLVEGKVIEALKPPYFRLDLDLEESGVRANMSEDYAFLENASAAGFPAYVDVPTSTKIGHMDMITQVIGE